MTDTTPIAVTSRSFSRHRILREELLHRYSNVRFNDEGQSLAGQELISFLKGRFKAITALEVLDESVLSALPDLKVVSKYGVGLDMLDLSAMERHGVLLGWEGGVNKRSVSELALSAMISLLHRVPFANLKVRSGHWQQTRGRQLSGKAVGIVGVGHIGKDLAVLLKSFDCKILAHDILDFPEFYAQYKVIPVELEELLSRSDIVTIHLPLDDSTKNIISAERLELMKPNAIFLNLARGGLVDEVKLNSMLTGGRLAGAALDVFQQEPPDDLKLINLPNVIATPHIGGSTEEAILAMGRAAIAGLNSAGPPTQVVC